MNIKRIFYQTVALLMLCYPSLDYAAIVIGNTHGNTVLTEVYDYSCVHCHRMEPVIEALIEQNPDLKVRFIPVALIDKDSLLTAATAWSVAKNTNQFESFHQQMLSGIKPNDSLINAVLEDLPIDTNTLTKIKADRHNPWIASEMDEGINLLKIYHSGTPLIIVTNNNSNYEPQVFRGETSLTTLTQAVRGRL